MKALLCPYEKIILSNKYACSYSCRGQRGERVLVECENLSAQTHCNAYLKEVRDKAQFTLKTDKSEFPLPFGKESKLLYGSVLSLVELAGNKDETRTRPDIPELLVQAIEKYSSIKLFPYELIVRHVAAYTSRRRIKHLRQDK
ncbi:MAG: hypothetical protein IME93_05740 [Proteobacteria bacterium]|nr:hypothetical protein [Pseudomonadota bacterium]